jgi:hypothetical protein
MAGKTATFPGPKNREPVYKSINLTCNRNHPLIHVRNIKSESNDSRIGHYATTLQVQSIGRLLDSHNYSKMDG